MLVELTKIDDVGGGVSAYQIVGTKKMLVLTDEQVAGLPTQASEAHLDMKLVMIVARKCAGLIADGLLPFAVDFKGAPQPAPAGPVAPAALPATQAPTPSPAPAPAPQPAPVAPGLQPSPTPPADTATPFQDAKEKQIAALKAELMRLENPPAEVTELDSMRESLAEFGIEVGGGKRNNLPFSSTTTQDQTEAS